MANAPEDLTRTSVAPTNLGASFTRTSGEVHEALEGRFTPGTLLNGRYRIISLLGRGGMGEVYRATDLTLGQSVALKFLPSLAGNEARTLERFHNEVRIARQVSHPNVCTVYDIGEAEGMVFLSMEYVDGEDLSTLLRRIGRLPGEKATEIGRKICAGLAAAHDKGVIHRDLKPHNVMLSKRGEVLICDFGLAALPDQINPSEYRQGTPAYMAPEQIKGTAVTAQSDIYALGLVLYELYTGKRPYSGTNLQELLAQQEAMSMTSMSSHASDIDPAVENIIKRCLDPDPARRPASALLVSMALPGGDPLAAALAAGQTPSPELVASSESTGLPLKYSLPLAAFVLLSLICMPLLKGKVQTHEYTPNDLPPAALIAKGRDIAAQAGFPAKPKDTFWKMQSRGGYVDYLDKNTKLRDWYAVFAAESPLFLIYRESPANFVRNKHSRVTITEPALSRPGELTMYLNSRGHLRGWEALPPKSTNDLATSPITGDDIARLTGLDLSAMEYTEPFQVPSTPYDTLVALKGPHPGIPSMNISLQYGLLNGRLTSLSFDWPWSGETMRMASAMEDNWANKFREAFLFLALMTFLLYSTMLAWRNWRQGRADHNGALKVSLARMAFDLVTLVTQDLHLKADADSFFFVLANLGDVLLNGALIYMLYLALEPALRARWPQSLVTWNRILTGRWNDPQVHSHVLMGAALGVFLVTGFLGKNTYEFFAQSNIDIGPTVMLGSWATVAGRLTTLASNAISTGLTLFFVIFGLKVLLKKDWLVILLPCLILPLNEGDVWQSQQFALDYGIYVVIYLIIILALVKFGLLTTLVGVFMVNALGGLPANNDFSVWYMPYTLFTLSLLMGAVIYSFFRSLGEQSLLGDGH
jgi:serine/threonine-protein kinase